MDMCVEETVCHRGFQFDNYARNMKLSKMGMQLPAPVKTGTTIVGMVFKDGVILGADTRATSGDIVEDKNCEKLHFIQQNMYCAGAGTAADLDMTTKMIASQMELHRLNTGRQVPVVTAHTMIKQMLFRYQGYIHAALILGGVDKFGFHVYSLFPYGSSMKQYYTTMGSGCLASMAVFESRWKPDMELEEAKKLTRDAVAAGVFNDLGSGSNIDLCVITRDGATLLRPYDVANVKGQRLKQYEFKKGITEVISVEVKLLGDGATRETEVEEETAMES